MNAMSPRSVVRGLTLVPLLWLAFACSSEPGRQATQFTESSAPDAPARTTPQQEDRSVQDETTTLDRALAQEDYGYTYGQPSGNRMVEGKANLRDASPVDVPLGGVPVWVVGAAFDEGVAWVAALEDGTVQAFYLDGSGEAAPLEISGGPLYPGEPPLLVSGDGSLEILAPDDNAGESRTTHPVPLENGDGILVVEGDGDVFIGEGGPGVRAVEIPVTATPDARVVANADGEYAVFSGPTGRYAHGVLGDGVEAGSIAVFDGNSLENVREIRAASGGVFEGISPMWIVKDGRDLLVVTESVEGLGSRVSVYGTDGALVSAGPFAGETFKWRHVLAAGPFGPEGELEIAVARTPHIDPVVEFYRFSGDRLEVSAEVPGYTSHRIYTRNLDTARAGDLDGDGRPELLVPDDSYTELAAIRKDADDASVVWSLPVGGEVSTNIGSATDEAGRTSVAVGRSDGTLRVWR